MGEEGPLFVGEFQRVITLENFFILNIDAGNSRTSLLKTFRGQNSHKHLQMLRL